MTDACVRTRGFGMVAVLSSTSVPPLRDATPSLYGMILGVERRQCPAPGTRGVGLVTRGGAAPASSSFAPYSTAKRQPWRLSSPWPRPWG